MLRCAPAGRGTCIIGLMFPHTCAPNAACRQHQVAENIRREQGWRVLRRGACCPCQPTAAFGSGCVLWAAQQRLGVSMAVPPSSPSAHAGYMAERLEIPADEVAEKCADYYLNFGTTLAGLIANG